MNEKVQIENYLDQKVNPLMEELLTNIIKSRPKNIVALYLLSLITAEGGSIKKQNIFKCFLTSQIQTRIKINIEPNT